jgi:hypothetical protein
MLVLKITTRFLTAATFTIATSFLMPPQAFSQATAFPHGTRIPTGNRPFTLQTASTKAACFPQKLVHILTYIRNQSGKKVILTSGYRPHASRQGSMHKHCAAADIRVPGLSDTQVIKIAKNAPGIGGVGQYCNGIVHVDVGPSRTWSDCHKGPHKKR